MRLSVQILATTAALFGAVPAIADSDGTNTGIAIATGLVIPQFDATRSTGSVAWMPRRWMQNTWTCR